MDSTKASSTLLLGSKHNVPAVNKKFQNEKYLQYLQILTYLQNTRDLQNSKTQKFSVTQIELNFFTYAQIGWSIIFENSYKSHLPVPVTPPKAFTKRSIFETIWRETLVVLYN